MIIIMGWVIEQELLSITAPVKVLLGSYDLFSSCTYILQGGIPTLSSLSLLALTLSLCLSLSLSLCLHHQRKQQSSGWPSRELSSQGWKAPAI